MFKILRLVCVGATFACMSSWWGSGQSSKPNDWAMNNARIGPDSPIEVPVGGSYDASVVYPVPDGPLYPLKADVTWWIEPAVRGIFIEAKSGKITVAQSVPPGTTATLHADVTGRKEKLHTQLFVYSPAANPLIGTWKIQSTQPCGVQPASWEKPSGFWYDASWSFYADNDFVIGRPSGIRGGVKQDGAYEYKASSGSLKMKPQWPAHQRESVWNAALKDDGATLELKAGKPQDGHATVCGYTLVRSVKKTSP